MLVQLGTENANAMANGNQRAFSAWLYSAALMTPKSKNNTSYFLAGFLPDQKQFLDVKAA